jgi:hypothetical protein
MFMGVYILGTHMYRYQQLAQSHLLQLYKKARHMYEYKHP